jgi:uncharacterized protein YdhG (YjbR/CyaY superfamily)
MSLSHLLIIDLPAYFWGLKKPLMATTPRMKFKTVEQYLSSLPEHARVPAEQLRATIRKAAPEAEEVISYNIPAFKWKGMLVWYAAFAHHLGLYPRVSAIEAFKKELSGYKSAKGSVQFPLDKPLPLGLISRIVKFRVKENGAG